jgi:hypothetical protein
MGHSADPAISPSGDQNAAVESRYAMTTTTAT